MTDEEIKDLSEFYKVFSDPTRLRILFFLDKNSPSNVNSIASSLCLSSNAVSQHLKILRLKRLVKYNKEGQNIFYRLSDDHIHQLLSLGLEHYRELDC